MNGELPSAPLAAVPVTSASLGLEGVARAISQHYDPEDLQRIRRTGSMWAVHPGNIFTACSDSRAKLAPGFYRFNSTPTLGLFMQLMDVRFDNLLALPDSVSAEIVKGIESFWGKEQKYRDFGFLWKRGVLLYGPPGGGKTSTTALIAKRVIERGGLAIYCEHPGLCATGLQMLRSVERTVPLVVIVEDMDAICEQYSESQLLSLLDGEAQIDNVVFVGTTNYPEKLDQRITNRPSRFDEIHLIGMPSKESRTAFLTARYPRCVAEGTLDDWVAASEDLSLAHLKEMIVSVEMFGRSLEEAKDRMKAMYARLPKTHDGKSEVGSAQSPDSYR